MDILYRTAPPAYRGCHPQPQQRTGLLAGFWCYLFGAGSAPAYRTKSGKNGSAAPTASRCWWQAFPSTPAYKPAPSPDVGLAPAEDDETAEDVPSEVYIVTG